MKLLRFFKNFLSVYITLIIAVILIFTTFIGYQFRRNYACDNVGTFIAIIALVVILYFVLNKLKYKNPNLGKYLHSDKCFYWVLIVGSIVMFALQIFIDAGGGIIAGGDTRNVIFPDMQMNADYMSMYPNQLFLAGFFRQIYFLITDIFGGDFNCYYFVLVIMSTLCVAISVILTGLIAKKIASPFIALITFLCAMLFLGFSPGIMIPYSDTFSMLCTTLCLFIYLYIKVKPIKWFLLFFVGIIGSSVKPTSILVILAILFVELSINIGSIKKTIKKINKESFAKVCISIMFAMMGFGLSNLISIKTCDYGVKVDDNRSFTATHFLMMGINFENHGGGNNDDVNISRSYKDVESRQVGNIREGLHRLKTYGPAEVAFIVLNKTLTNFNDGSFAGEAELPGCIENRGDNPIVGAFYGIDPADDHNDNNNFSAYPRQALGMMILIGCAFVVFNKKPKKGEFVIYLSILAISAFLTIFEPDPRYLLLYTPYFAVIAPKGGYLAYKAVFNKFNLKYPIRT